MPGIAYYEAIRKDVIHVLQKERERLNLSKYAVSQKCGVSQSMLGQMEKGLRNPTMEILLRVADGIGADLPSIIKGAIARQKRLTGAKGGSKARQ